MAKTAKTTKSAAKATYVVVIAEYDESGSDGLAIDNALVFDSAEKAAEFIVADYDDTIINAFGDEADGDTDYPSLPKTEIIRSVKRLKDGGCAEWDTPSDSPVWVKWKVFRTA